MTDSPRQNRVTPLGALVAAPARGLVYGNRGCLHDPSGRIVRAANGNRWLACRLEFRGRRRELLQPGRFTELFFLDEATALAAGHRPCALCRREDYNALVLLWRRLGRRERGADAIDLRLQRERFDSQSGRQRHHRAAFAGLPDGTTVLHEGAPRVVAGAHLLRWGLDGYRDSVPRPRDATAVVVTPPSLVALLGSGWHSQLPLLHPSAAAAT